MICFLSVQGKDIFISSITDAGIEFNKTEKVVTYKMDIQFSKMPLDYWIYYDHANGKLVLDCYGIHVYTKLNNSSKPRGVFKKIEIVNEKTDLSLSGKRSILYIKIEPDPDWCVETQQVQETILRIVVWKNVSQLTKVKKKEKKSIHYILLVSLVSLASFGIVATILRVIPGAE